MSNDAYDAPALLAEVARLQSAGQHDAGRERLLDEAFVERSHPVLQARFVDMFPIGAVLADVLATVYQGIDDPDPKRRFAAATAIAKELGKERLRDNTRWMRDPRATDPLIRACRDSDSKVAERALGTLARIVGRYFPDQRTEAVFRENLAHKKQERRSFAISGMACLRQESLLHHLIPLLRNGTDKDRSDVTSQIWGAATETPQHSLLRPMNWSDTGRAQWRQLMTEALSDPAVPVRKHAARALARMGDASSVKALRAARRSETDEDTGFYMDEALAALGG